MSCVSVELQSSVSENGSASIIRVDVMSDVTTHCIYIHDWLLEPMSLSMSKPIGTVGRVRPCNSILTLLIA
jgi:hypothetical protein